jgi:4-aminobutyrate aminotransferase-like enzyme
MVQRETEGDIAGVITEAYQGGAGSIIPPAAWMKKLEAWCRKNDVVFIMDEVQASFGRTGRMFCFEHYDVTPNLLCLGKGISSSVPVSALVGESKLMDVLEPGTMSSTHGGNAFCSRVALRNVELIEEERLVENSAKVGAYFGERFADLQQRCDRLGDARGMGMVWGLEMVKTKEGKEPDTEITRRIIDGCFRRGLLLIAPIGLFGNVIRVAPPLVMTEEEAKIGCDILAEVMMEAAAH